MCVQPNFVNLSMVGVDESHLWAGSLDTRCKQSFSLLYYDLRMADRVLDVAQQAIAAVRDARRSLDDDADDFVAGVTQTFHRRHGTSRRRSGRRTSNGMSMPLDLGLGVNCFKLT